MLGFSVLDVRACVPMFCGAAAPGVAALLAELLPGGWVQIAGGCGYRNKGTASGKLQAKFRVRGHMLGGGADLWSHGHVPVPMATKKFHLVLAELTD